MAEASRLGAAAPQEFDRSPAAVRELRPEIYYLQNDAGRLVPVPGFQYRDFVELLRLREGMPKPPQAPDAVLERLEVFIDLAEANLPADAAVSIELSVTQSSAGWVSLPIDLPEVLLTGPPRHVVTEGQDGRFLVDVEQAGHGYRCWFQGSAGTRHQVVLEGRLPVERTRDSTVIAIDLPRANASRLQVRSSLADPAVTVEPGVLPPKVEADADGGSVISLVGLVGASRIRLSSRSELNEPSAAAPQAAAEMVVAVDGRHVTTDAIIRLDHLPSDRTNYTVRLPAYASLERLAAPSTLVAVRGTDEAPEVVVMVDRDRRGRGVIELRCEAPVEPGGRPLESLAFGIAEIPGWRQWGEVSVLVEGDWQVEWDAGGTLRRIDPRLPLRRRGCVAAFAYDAQPASLPLRVRPLRSRVVVEPDYQVRVAATRIDLEARLRVTVRGAPISQMQVAVPGWDVKEIGPAGLVDTSAIGEAVGTVDIPFVQGLSGDAIVEIRATRAVSRDTEQIEWNFPMPVADLVGPASVAIFPESDIELNPETDALRGLVRQVSPSLSGRPAEAEPPPARGEIVPSGRGETNVIAYRLDGPSGRFAATRRFLPRRLGASLAVKLDIEDGQIGVEEAIRFDVAFVPLEAVEFSIPEAVLASDTLEVRQGGQLLSVQSLAARPAESPAESIDEEPSTTMKSLPAQGQDEEPSRARMRVLLPTPLLGVGELFVRYTLPTARPPAETTLAEEVPLVMPLGASFGKQSVAIESSRGLSVEVRGETWKRDIAVQGSSLPQSWVSSRSQDVVLLAIATEPQTFGETVVDAAWFETHLLPDVRQDIFRYRIATSADRIELQLPEVDIPTSSSEAAANGLGGSGTISAGSGFAGSEVEVLLDGRPVVDALRPNGRILIGLPGGGKLRTYSVEIDVQRTGAFRFAGVPLDGPKFESGAVERRFYWEVRLRPDEHVLVGPRGWTAQQEWVWGSSGFLPRPIISPEMLTRWMASSPTPADPTPRPTLPQAARRAVFSGVGHPGPARIVIVPTWLLVLAASGPVLVAGLLFVQWPSARQPWLLMLSAITVTSAAAVFPTQALLVAQAAIPGVLLSILAAGLRLALRRPMALEPQRGGDAVLVSQSSTRVAIAPYVSDSSHMQRRLATERSAS